jgi:hypothetical protein
MSLFLGAGGCRVVDENGDGFGFIFADGRCGGAEVGGGGFIIL